MLHARARPGSASRYPVGVMVSELGEFGLIDRLRKTLGASSDDQLIVGSGDDAAVWRNGPGVYTIATTDTMVAGVHFLPNLVRWQDVGWKALAVNISDIAAMGGKPRYAMVTLCLPPDTPVEHVDGLYVGLRECAAAYGVTIVGGDIVSASEFAVTIALVGEAAVSDTGEPLLLRRDAARVGDVVAVTGHLGGAAAGLLVLKDGASSAAVASRLVRKQMHPVPRLDAGDVAVRAGVECAIDISDGLVQDLGHICKLSKVSAELRLDAIPLDESLIKLSGQDHPWSFRSNEATVLAATGGEDYELLLVASQRRLDAVSKTVSLTVVGRIEDQGVMSVSGTRKRIRCIDSSGDEVRLTKTGWKHF